MPTITFVLTRDNTGLAGAVRAIRQGADYVVPTLDLASLPHSISTAPLPASGVFTQAWQDRYDDALVTRLRAQVMADQAGTVYLEQSPDGATANPVASLAIAANANGDTSWWLLTQRYYRVRFVNGGVGQAAFNLYLEYDVPRAGIHPGAGALTDRSSTITTGNVSQVLMPLNPTRRYLWVQNLSSGALWINFTSAATLSLPSIQIPSVGLAGSIFSMDHSFVSNEAINIIGGTTAQAFAAKEGS